MVLHQTPHEVEPVQIWPPRELVKVYQNLGVSEKLGLRGRPTRPIGALGTSKVSEGPANRVYVSSGKGLTKN